jgi:hypothetical protein
MLSVPYCTREQVKTALDVDATAGLDTQVDRVILAASRLIEGDLHRRFYPWVGTRYFDWPNDQRARPWRLWLGPDELVTVTAFASGSETVPAASVKLWPQQGPPYTRLELDQATLGGFTAGPSYQDTISVTGTFGYSAEFAPAGTIAEGLDASETDVDVSNAAAVGVGDLLQVDTERMLVTGRRSLDTTATVLGAGETSSMADTSVGVDSGAKLNVGETITVDAERMLITDITGNTLTVRRAQDGTVLASHASLTPIYAARTLTVTRGALGTSAATHSTAAAITRHVVPSGINALAIGQALYTLRHEQIGYGFITVGSGTVSRDLDGKALIDLWAQARTTYGRRARQGAV